jgi:hypothetical protein
MNSNLQETVDSADEFPVVWSRFREWLKSLGAFENLTDFAFLTCGDWDLKTMLPEQLAYTARTRPNIGPAVLPWIAGSILRRLSVGTTNGGKTVVWPVCLST